MTLIIDHMQVGEGNPCMLTRQGQDKLFTATMWKSPVKLSKAYGSELGGKKEPWDDDIQHNVDIACIHQSYSIMTYG